MNSAKFSFKILQYFGIWRPTSWTLQWTIQLYNFYSFLMVTLFLVWTASFSIYTVQTRRDVDSLTENLFYTVALFSLNFKVFKIFMHRDDIIVFDNMFLEIHCCPRDVSEVAIIEKFHNSNRLNTKFFLTVGCVFIVIICLVNPLVTKESSISLPLKMWLPYTCSTDSKFIFWFTYLFEVGIVVTVTSVLIAIDCYITGLMQQISAQLEIIKRRLWLITDLFKDLCVNANNFETEFQIRDCIVHHSYMYLAGQRLNNLLSSTAFLQFFVTILGLCTVLYQLTITGVHSGKFWISLTASNNYLFEIFLLCWYGQEVIDKSLAIADATLAANWVNLTRSSKQYLILISLRARKPILLSGVSIVPLSVGTFLKILKVSYSAFSLIRSL